MLGSFGDSKTTVGCSVGSAWVARAGRRRVQGTAQSPPPVSSLRWYLLWRVRLGKKMIFSLLWIPFVRKLLTKRESRGLLKCTCSGEEFINFISLSSASRQEREELSDGRRLY